MPSRKVRARDIPHLPFAHKLVQRVQRLLHRSRSIESMHVVHIDVIRLQALQTSLQRLNQVIPARPCIVRPISHPERRLRRYQYILPLQVRQRATLPPSQRLLALTIRVHVRRIEEVDPRLHAHVHDPPRLILRSRTPCLEEIAALRPKRPRTKAKLRHLQT